MINNKLNNCLKYTLAFLLASMMVIGLAMPVNAAKEYKISFKAGSKGVYNDGATSKNDKVIAGEDLNIAPDTLVASLEIEDGYYFNGWNYTVKQSEISKSANYVAQYKRIVDEAVYRVSYVDNFGNQLATQKVVTSNVGIVVAENAINIEGYAVDQLTKTAKVEKEGTEIVFTYVSTVEGNVQTVIQNDVVVVAGTGTGAGGAGTQTGTGTAGGTTTPGGTTGNEAGGTGGLGTEEVTDEETPLAGGEKNVKSDSNNNALLIGGGVVGLVILAGVVYYIVKSKKVLE